MKSLFSGNFRCLLLCTALGMAVGEAAANTIGISDNPLQTAVGVPPNVLFVIDDSGSMEWGFLPDALGERLTSNGRHLSENCAGIGTYGGVSNTCYLNTTGRAYMMSPHLNKAYYDNNKTYAPPVNSAGQSLGPASFTSARRNGYLLTCPQSECFDLRSEYRAIMANNSFTGTYSGRTRTGFTISPDAKAGAAFYYEYTPGCTYGEYDDRCYTYKTITADKQTNFANWFSYYRTRLMAAKAGKHLIIEKPISLSLADAHRVSAAVKAAGVKTCVCFECRYSSQLVATKAVIDSGLLGKLHYGEVDYYHGIGPWYGQFRWNTGKKDGGSALLTAGR